MKKLLPMLVLALCLAFVGLAACDAPETPAPDTPPTTTYTVAFEVDGVRHATKKVEAGKTVESGSVVDPSKTGYDFDYWTLDGVQTDIYTYVINANTTFVAHFTEKTPEPVEPEEPEDDTNYFNVYIQVYSTNLTQDEAERFKTRFFDTIGVSDGDITRFHIEEGDSTAFTEIINGATDVDVVIGGNNPLKNFAYNPAYYNTEGEALMNVASGHFNSTNRKIIIMSACDNMELAVRLYEFATTPYVVNDINITVTVHGNTDAITVLTDAETVIAFPEFTVGDNEVFKGFSTVEYGMLAIVCAIDAELKYDNIKTWLPANATTLNLYPVIEEKPVVREYYVKIAWYDNSKSGLDATIIDEIKTALIEYLTAEGVSTEDIATIEFKAYSGNVGPSTDDINADGNVDIMIGWGSDSNITTTGHISASSIVESISGFTMGTATRYVHVLSSDASVVKTMEFIRSADLTNFKAPVAAE